MHECQSIHYYEFAKLGLVDNEILKVLQYVTIL